MAAENSQTTSWLTRTFDTSLTLYRKTLKRFQPLHILIHHIMTHGVIPLLERLKGFHTIPDDPFWFRLELLTNRHEQETTQQIRRLVKPGMMVLDVGAHVGYYARMCAGLVGKNGRVVAFEPHPRTHAVLHRNIQHLPNVTTKQIAVAESEGTAELYDYLMMSASGSLHYDESMVNLQKSQLGDTDIAPRIAEDFPVETFTVQTMPIDSCLEELGIQRVDVVKMDVEGAEMGALRGMRQTIARSSGMSLIMEYNPQALRSFGFDPVEAMAEVLAMGFQQMQMIHEDGSLSDLTGDDAQIRQITDQLMQQMGVVNLLFSREP